jgi:cytochrome c oxidase accessory protein FixG
MSNESAACAAPGRKMIPIASEAPAGLYRAEKKIHPREIRGRFTTWRWATVAATQLAFYGLPWLEWNGRQALLFDLAARRFYIFGLVLYPQDFVYLAALLIVSAYSLFLFTAVAGRLWCGFACPQTVYTEVFLWIERRFEGDRSARLRLDAAPWSYDKAWRKTGKQASWIALALWTGFTFVGFFAPIHMLAHESLALSFGAWEWFWILFYAFATYGNAGWMREQVCKYMCPYARFQSAMFDRDTLVVTYDGARGEPRGPRAKSLAHADLAAAGKGECIDCTMCVQVCPTGIDIRKGLQYECIGCAACVDACDGVMDKLRYPRGLIRFTTENGLERGWTGAQMLRRVARPRVLVYSGVLMLIVAAISTNLALRRPFRVDVLRDRGTLAREVAGGRIENVYRLQVMNASESPQRFHVAVAGLDGIAIASDPELSVDATGQRSLAVRVQVPLATAEIAGAGAQRIDFTIRREGDDRAPLTERSTFLIPR